MIGSSLVGANAPNLSGKKKFNMMSLMENPLLLAGLGVLGSNGNAAQGGLMGLQAANQFKDQRLGRERDAKEDQYKASRRKRESLLDTRQDEQYQKDQEFRSALGLALNEGDKETALKLFAENKPEAAFQVLQGDRKHDQSLDFLNAQIAARRGAGPDIGTYNPRDYTVDSFAKFAQSQNPSDLVRHNPLKEIDLGGGRKGFYDSLSGRLVTESQGAESFNENVAGTETAKRKAGKIGDYEGEKVAGASKARLNRALQSMGVENVREQIKEAKDLSSNWSTGVGAMLKGLPSTDARALDNKLLTIKSNIGFDKLQAMRAASPTGGALGQVAVQELEGLQATIEKLDQFSSDADLDKALDKIDKHYSNWLRAMESHYASEYGNEPESLIEADTNKVNVLDMDGWQVEEVN